MERWRTKMKKVKENVVFFEKKDGMEQMEVTYTIGNTQEHKFTYDLSTKGHTTLVPYIHNRLRASRSVISNILYASKFLSDSKILTEHMAIWYPFYDADMAKNRNYIPTKETKELRSNYTESINSLDKPFRVNEDVNISDKYLVAHEKAVKEAKEDCERLDALKIAKKREKVAKEKKVS